MVGHWDFAYGPDQLLKLNDQVVHGRFFTTIY